MKPWMMALCCILATLSGTAVNVTAKAKQLLGEQNSLKGIDKSQDMLDYQGNDCQRWRFEFQKALPFDSSAFVDGIVPCDDLCETAFMDALTEATKRDRSATTEPKIDECVAASGACGGLAQGAWPEPDNACRCKTALVVLRLHGYMDNSNCERTSLHQRLATALNWTVDGSPILRKTGLRCDQPKSSQCTCAKLDPATNWYGVAQGNNCPDDIMPADVALSANEQQPSLDIPITIPDNILP
ncbi:hypothetical protein BCR37DRAFT_394953 [Protomyces lactucae-debilis]|uniref:Uncharacterized protein n=1 Tax=Protomyces lactucae-debilis TaxID=2754530 RepID=A0A1Y2F2Z2_PROLT|nr:uncharacterized protein BCR37DRAFT_394953 [Protomyces lactucae-debilis]ORY77335.1 hypothetical protein BCR37DRAFT_394953 [Protomyces lactucae-debilis]